MGDQWGSAAKGAAGGAMAGAAFGGVGAAIGGVAGGLYGYFSSPDTETVPTGPASGNYQTNYLQQLLGRGAPMMDASQSNQSRAQQNQLAQMLFAQANGQQVGAGEMAVNRQVGQAQANQTGTAQMARGANAALAARTAARMNADIGVNGAGAAAQAQIQDQTNARGQLGTVLGGMRGQDISVAGSNQQAMLAQQQAQLAGLGQLLNVDQSTLTQGNKQADLNAAAQARYNAQLASMMQAGGQAAAGYAAYSRGQNSQVPPGSVPGTRTTIPNGSDTGTWGG